ncbi:MAG: helix-turn-helix transcriptional regulator [Sphaerochaetaceae bacterium]|nr:helix-turn-helix transcriptional regulator [Sphaerochaetaceae bacterium]
MFIIGDILLFAVTALVLSITCLCILLHIRARDAYTKDFLLVLTPLCLQICLMMLMTYVHRVYPPQQLSGKTYEVFCLWITLSSILLTTALLFMMSRYLIALLPISPDQRKIGNFIIVVIVAFFLILSLFFIIGESQGNWVIAMNLTFGYHFFSASMLMVAHGITSLIFRKKASGWEQESLLKGISATFLPLIITFPLDLIFFDEHTFKLAFLSFAVFVVYLYLFISRRYFQDYEVPFLQEGIPQGFLAQKGVSSREEEIIEQLVQGKTNHEIAEHLFISTNTVKTHIKNIYSKLKVSNRVQLFSLLRGKHIKPR